jgi:hypothetical protein
MRGDGDWNRKVDDVDSVIDRFRDWHYEWLDVPAMLRGANEMFEFPMIDRDPVPTWVDGHVALDRPDSPSRDRSRRTPRCPQLGPGADHGVRLGRRAACLPSASRTRRAHELQRSLRERYSVRGFHQNQEKIDMILKPTIGAGVLIVCCGLAVHARQTPSAETPRPEVTKAQVQRWMTEHDAPVSQRVHPGADPRRVRL